MKPKALNRIIFVQALLGIAIAAYVSYTWITSSPIVCLTNGCETVRKSALAWPFGIPFPLFGLFGYSIIAVLAFIKTLNAKKIIDKLLVGMGGFGTLLVTYFTILETFFIKGYCMWCVISAINMIVIFGLAIYAYRQKHSQK